MGQKALNLNAPAIDLTRFVAWNEYPDRPFVVIAGGEGRRAGQRGRALGCVALKRSPGYDVVVEFADGKVESFSPMAIFPAPDSSAEDDDEMAPEFQP